MPRENGVHIIKPKRTCFVFLESAMTVFSFMDLLVPSRFYPQTQAFALTRAHVLQVLFDRASKEKKNIFNRGEKKN